MRQALGASLLLTVWSAQPLLAHEGLPLQPHDLWSAWTLDATITVPLLLLAFVVIRGRRTLARRGGAHGARTCSTRLAAFVAGWIVLACALVSPLHALGEVVFTAHMVQHVLLVGVAAPLLVAARPFAAAAWAVPAGWRRGLSALSHHQVISRIWAAVTQPLVAWAAHGIILWLWHLPALYQRTLSSDLAHALQHLTFLVSGLLFWWSLMRGRASRMIGVVALFATAVHTGALGALMTLAPTVWYPAYGAQSIPWGLTPMEDQQLGGIVMWMPAALTYVAGALWLAAGALRVPAMTPLRASLGMAMLVLLAGCRFAGADEGSMLNGDPERGKRLVRLYGCNSCHTIPDFPGDEPTVGPSLEGIARRSFIGGVLTNSPENLVRWILDPPAIDSLTAMPNVHVAPHDAVDIAEYLYTLK